MSVHENEHTSAVVHSTASHGTPRDAEATIAAFLVALGELGQPVPNNSYRAIVTRSGLQIEVFDDGKPAVRTYGTPAPVEEIAELLLAEVGPPPLAEEAEGFLAEPFKPGERIRALCDTESWGGEAIGSGAVLTVGEGDHGAYTEPGDDEDSHVLVAGRDARRAGEWLVDPSHFERVA